MGAIANQILPFPQELVSPLSRILPSQPAEVIDLAAKRQERHARHLIFSAASEGILQMRCLILEYEIAMREAAQQMSPEQLEEIAPLSAEQHILEDVRRLNLLVGALQNLIAEKKGRTLAQAGEVLKLRGGEEIFQIMGYLEQSDFEIFQKIWARMAGATPRQ